MVPKYSVVHPALHLRQQQPEAAAAVGPFSLIPCPDGGFLLLPPRYFQTRVVDGGNEYLFSSRIVLLLFFLKGIYFIRRIKTNVLKGRVADALVDAFAFRVLFVVIVLHTARF